MQFQVRTKKEVLSKRRKQVLVREPRQAAGAQKAALEVQLLRLLSAAEQDVRRGLGLTSATREGMGTGTAGLPGKEHRHLQP